MKRITFKILFVTKQSRVTRSGETPVFLRVTVNGQRCETSISLKVKPKKWNSVAERLIGDSREEQELNFRLDTIRMRIMQIYREMEFDRETIAFLQHLLNITFPVQYFSTQLDIRDLTAIAIVLKGSPADFKPL